MTKTLATSTNPIHPIRVADCREWRRGATGTIVRIFDRDGATITTVRWDDGTREDVHSSLLRTVA